MFVLADGKSMSGRAVIVAVIFAMSLYASVACVFYRFNHPWMTDTELTLHFIDAMLWRPA